MIEKIVTSLETSRKLKELGVVQESCFYWYLYTDKKKLIDYKEAGLLNGTGEIISAWTATELGQMIWSDVWFPKDPNRGAEEIMKFIEVYKCAEPIKTINQNLKEWREK